MGISVQVYTRSIKTRRPLLHRIRRQHPSPANSPSSTPRSSFDKPDETQDEHPRDATGEDGEDEPGQGRMETSSRVMEVGADTGPSSIDEETENHPDVDEEQTVVELRFRRDIDRRSFHW
jgi:hypothetical protein